MQVIHARDIIEGRGDVLAFAAAEFLEIHRLLDHCNITQEFNGERLSTSQRVARLVDLYNAACFDLDAAT